MLSFMKPNIYLHLIYDYLFFSSRYLGETMCKSANFLINRFIFICWINAKRDSLSLFSPLPLNDFS